MKKTNKNTSIGLSLGMCLGVSLGLVCGESLFGSQSLGISMGISLGMCIGLAIGSAKDKKINEQLENEGYTIKEIIQKETEKDYNICVISRAGEERYIQVTDDEMKSEAFAQGDLVYLNEEGHLEQAFGKEEM